MIGFFLFLHKILPGHSIHFRRFIYRPFYFVHNYVIGFFLARFTEKDLPEVNRRAYKSRCQYSSDNYNKNPLFKWEADVVELFFPKEASVLVTAVGGGREAYNLLKMGFTVDSCETNDMLREYGNAFFVREGMPNVIFKEDDAFFDHIKGEKKYDVIIVGWGAYNHIKGQSKRISYLKMLSQLLHKKGVILISFWGQQVFDEHFNQLSLKRIFNTAKFFNKFTAADAPEYGDVLMPEYYHFFNENEIQFELSEAGFNMVRYNEEGYGNAVGQLK
jgi:hypothetical protein